jgi:hypothetical protein
MAGGVGYVEPSNGWDPPRQASGAAGAMGPMRPMGHRAWLNRMCTERHNKSRVSHRSTPNELPRWVVTYRGLRLGALVELTRQQWFSLCLPSRPLRPLRDAFPPPRLLDSRF